MPAHSSTGQKPEAYFARLLAALAIAAGGSLRIKGSDVDSIDKEVVLVKDWDGATQEVIIRVGTRFNEVYRVQPEVGTTWQAAAPQAPTTQTPASPSSSRPVASTLDDDARLVDLERTLRKRRIAKMYRDELMASREEELLRRAGVPEPSSRS